MLHQLVDSVERARDGVINAVKDLRPDQATFKPSPDTWSIAGPLAVWVSCFRSLRPVLSDLAKELEPLDLEAIVYPHYLSGPLDGRQRLEFLRYHMERHLTQIQSVKAHPQFPA